MGSSLGSLVDCLDSEGTFLNSTGLGNISGIYPN